MVGVTLSASTRGTSPPPQEALEEKGQCPRLDSRIAIVQPLHDHREAHVTVFADQLEDVEYTVAVGLGERRKITHRALLDGREDARKASSMQE
jgi:hypothetical protein